MMANPFSAGSRAPDAPQVRPRGYTMTTTCLGHGTYAVVHEGHRAADGYPVAVKIVRQMEGEGVPTSLIREAAILRRLHHPNLVSLLDYAGDGTNVALIFERCDSDLHQLLRRDPSRVRGAAMHLFRQLLSAVDYLTKCGIVHRDVKPHNLLLYEQDLILKLADFGLARPVGVPVMKYDHSAATPWYRPPDVALGSANYYAGIDVWSAGCIFFEMLSGTPMFAGVHTDGQLLQRIRSWIGEPSNDELAVLATFPSFSLYTADLSAPVSPMVWPDSIGPLEENLIRRLLRYLPGDRLSAAQALSDPCLDLSGPCLAPPSTSLPTRAVPIVAAAENQTPGDTAPLPDLEPVEEATEIVPDTGINVDEKKPGGASASGSLKGSSDSEGSTLEAVQNENC